MGGIDVFINFPRAFVREWTQLLTREFQICSPIQFAMHVTHIFDNNFSKDFSLFYFKEMKRKLKKNTLVWWRLLFSSQEWKRL